MRHQEEKEELIYCTADYLRPSLTLDARLIIELQLLSPSALFHEFFRKLITVT